MRYETLQNVLTLENNRLLGGISDSTLRQATLRHRITDYFPITARFPLCFVPYISPTPTGMIIG